MVIFLLLLCLSIHLYSGFGRIFIIKVAAKTQGRGEKFTRTPIRLNYLRFISLSAMVLLLRYEAEIYGALSVLVVFFVMVLVVFTTNLNEKKAGRGGVVLKYVFWENFIISVLNIPLVFLVIRASQKYVDPNTMQVSWLSISVLVVSLLLTKLVSDKKDEEVSALLLICSGFTAIVAFLWVVDPHFGEYPEHRFFFFITGLAFVFSLVVAFNKNPAEGVLARSDFKEIFSHGNGK